MSSSPDRAVILQILPALEQGGVERGTLEMADAITLAGGRAMVVSAGGRLEPHLRRVGAEHITLPHCGSRNPLRMLGNARTLARIMDTHGVSLVHARSRAPAWVARLACRKRRAWGGRTPLITTWHGVHASSWPGKRFYNAVLASGTRVIAISRHIAQRLAADYHVGPDRLRTIPRGADVQQFDPAAVSGQRQHLLAEQWDIPPDMPVILMPGRLTHWKGQGLVLQALALLARTHPALKWCCVFAGSETGSARYAQDLAAQAAQLGLTDVIRFGGHCDDMPAAMALAAMVVVPSLRPEPFGRVVVEAQAMGRPVLAAHHGAAAETVEHGVTGLCVPPNNAQALAEAIHAILSMPSAGLEAMGQAARQMVLARYTTQAMQHATLAVYDEVLHTALAPAFARTLEDRQVARMAAQPAHPADIAPDTRPAPLFCQDHHLAG
ncbi:glycosyltransferase family 4 protein [Acetobacter sp. TBRC 12305]|uniref:Glycosyltransferase family 4 protein n=1 Tax=Acetobacter garciniae TaxID=2817435 RepID=A0A939HRQ9_9PROT|nr:glycosyltransferase family 4 protein [Acetobacter garciniae]MBO1326626.1 glycosyltransferase family 4 protein [Acetobacter garciniae]MBX0346326.1 glycosyltransferase family 4 protein [Acetobacter garciniae]